MDRFAEADGGLPDETIYQHDYELYCGHWSTTYLLCPNHNHVLLMEGWDYDMFEIGQVYSKNPRQVRAGEILRAALACRDIRYKTNRRNDGQYTQTGCQIPESWP
jgi:hypothetical protein